jgi:hypothetical protein
MMEHDALYHRLFPHAGMVEDLLRGFVAEPWLNELDLRGMERIDAKFHAESGTRREGDIVWRIPTLIGLPPGSPFWPWQPELRYHLIDEGKAEPAERDTLAALPFQLEQCRDLDQLKPLTDALIAWFDRHPAFEAVESVFALMVGRLLNTMADAELAVPEDLLEVKTMLTERAEEWKRQLRQEGHRKGEMAIVLGQLEYRFGAVPDWARERLIAANPADLQAWSRRLLDARSLDEVFH